MPPVELRTARSYWLRIGFILGLLSLLSVPILARGLGSFDTRSGRTLTAMGALLALAPIVIVALDRSRWVRVFDERGVTKRSGRFLPWTDFREVRAVHLVTKYGTSAAINHYELVFAHGKAAVFPLVTENLAEVMSIVTALQRGDRPPFAAPHEPAPAPIPAASPPMPPHAPLPIAAPHPLLPPQPIPATLSPAPHISESLVQHVRSSTFCTATLHGLLLEVGDSPTTGNQSVLVLASRPDDRAPLWSRELTQSFMMADAAKLSADGPNILLTVDGEHARGGHAATWTFRFSPNGDRID
jgi:hypothetical protein